MPPTNFSEALNLPGAYLMTTGVCRLVSAVDPPPYLLQYHKSSTVNHVLRTVFGVLFMLLGLGKHGGTDGMMLWESTYAVIILVAYLLEKDVWSGGPAQVAARWAIFVVMLMLLGLWMPVGTDGTLLLEATDVPIILVAYLTATGVFQLVGDADPTQAEARREILVVLLILFGLLVRSGTGDILQWESAVVVGLMIAYQTAKGVFLLARDKQHKVAYAFRALLGLLLLLLVFSVLVEMRDTLLLEFPVEMSLMAGTLTSISIFQLAWTTGAPLKQVSLSFFGLLLMLLALGVHLGTDAMFPCEISMMVNLIGANLTAIGIFLQVWDRDPTMMHACRALFGVLLTVIRFFPTKGKVRDMEYFDMLGIRGDRF
ncbi:uncharacterized protein LOC126198753 [Schistocerca nitens]|uniref:uncharacterized protein LOC126198753 n=1 Tax=Schistocerca nitens TaxID=7011 RepID=UPI0021189031|nr:uncharacterized protein LOC126198753 [Schistocerca nitens]XP_049791266.1 uncharacterized protein LOC126198753 [Schistocerca nitens]